MVSLLLLFAGLLPAQAPVPSRAPIIFTEPGFPAMDVDEILPVEGAREAKTATELSAALADGGVLVWRHGSTFPAEAWGDLKQFLERGGAMVVLGG